MASNIEADKPRDIQLKANKIQDTIDRAFGSLKARSSKLDKTRAKIKDKSGGEEIYEREQKIIQDEFRKEMGSLITKDINFEIKDGKFYPVREQLRKEVEDGEETMFKDYVPTLDEGYDIFTELDEIKTYLEEKFIPIKAPTQSTGSNTFSKYNTKTD